MTHTPEASDPIARFVRGEISRKRAMRDIGDISYGELIEMVADRGLSLPEASEEEVDRMADTVSNLLRAAGR